MAKSSGRKQDFILTPPDQGCKDGAAKLETRQEASRDKPNEANLSYCF